MVDRSEQLQRGYDHRNGSLQHVEMPMLHTSLRETKGVHPFLLVVKCVLLVCVSSISFKSVELL